MTRKLFISHSSKTPDNLALLQTVCTGLADKGFDILVDNGGQLYAGVDWELRINEWMAECHAAVILFSTAALRDSEWVKKEAAILSWRRELQEDFVLIPVLLEGITPEDLEQGLSRILRITKSQCIRNATAAQQIVDQVAQGLGPAERLAKTPFERLQGVLAEILEKQARPETLEDAWNLLDGANKPQWQPDRGRRFATALVRFMLRDRLGAIQHLQTVLDRIRPRIRKDAAEELLKYLACLWIDAEAAGGISAAPSRAGIVALNGNYLPDFTARRYAERAWPLCDQWRYIPVDTSARSVNDILEVIRQSFRPRGGSIPGKVIDKLIKNYEKPVLVLIPSAGEPPQLPDETLLSELRAHYPKLIYMIGTGPRIPDWVPAGIEPLLPPLDINVEEEQLFALADMQDFIENRLYGSP
ncbi:MAG: toll/interleukin-1 receptor domain-containing protein [Chromatiales bacterium]|jgi:hypothetical protein